MGVLVKLIHNLNHGLGLTSIVVSHDVRETVTIADYVYLISEGKVVAQGTPDEIEATPSPWIRQFLHGEADGPVPFHFPAPDYADDLLGAGKPVWHQ